jgi:hypothetical protein
MNFKTIIGALGLFAFASCSNNNSESGFELTGKFTNFNGETIIFEQMAPDGLKALDTAIIDENGEIKINVAIPEKGFYRLKISDKNFATFILDTNEKVTVGGNAADFGNTYTVEGSPDSKLFWEINQAHLLRPIADFKKYAIRIFSNLHHTYVQIDRRIPDKPLASDGTVMSELDPVFKTWQETQLALTVGEVFMEQFPALFG